MTPRKKHSHCGHCGHPFDQAAPWPRSCGACCNVTYRNPLPVAVALVPVDDGLLCIRRTIEPKKGELALPGGFLEVDETWQEGCVRELREETGVVADAEEIRLFAAYSAPRVGAAGESILLVFGLARPRRAEELAAFAENEETSEMVVIRGPTELAFETHTRAVKEYFEGRSG